MPRAIIGWRWRSRSRRSPPSGRRGSKARTSVAISYPGFFETLASLVAPASSSLKTDKVYLVGFMGAGKTTVARALARRLDWRAVDIDELIEQREHQTVADVFARHGEPYFRAVERAVLVDQLGAAPLRRRDRRRHVRRSAEPRRSSTATGVSVWLDVPLTAADCPGAGRRPASAGRRSGRIRAAVRRPARGLRTGPPARRGRTAVGGRDRRRVGGLAGRVGEYAPALPRPDRHPREPRGARRVPGRRAAPRLRRDARARRHRRLRRRSERGHRRVHELKPRGDRARQPRQGRAAASIRPTASTRSRAPPRSGRSSRSTPENRAWLAALPKGPLAVDDLVEICHGSPFDEDAYIFDETDALRALKATVAAALPLRPHPLPRHLPAGWR